MEKAPFARAKSRAFGKSESNTLVLNTHLDITVALDRSRCLTGDGRYAARGEFVRKATRTILAARPAECLYRLVFSAVNLTLLPTTAAARLPLWRRAWKRAGWKFFAPRRHRLKARYPRLVMPAGYIDRAGPLQGFAFHYPSVNLMDLVHDQSRFGAELPHDALTDGLRFTQTSGVRERWTELKYERYALGFWAECLTLLCLQNDDFTYRAWLAEAALMLEKLGMGLPPSTLGANADAVASSDQRAKHAALPAGLRAINLCRADLREFLILNTSDSARSWRSDAWPGYVWRNGASEPRSVETSLGLGERLLGESNTP